MNSSKRKFLAVTVTATAALAAAITLSVIWVVNTYRDRQEEFASSVNAALKKPMMRSGRPILQHRDTTVLQPPL